MDERKIHYPPVPPVLKAVNSQLCSITGWELTLCKMRPEHGGHWVMAVINIVDGRQYVVAD